MPRMLLDGEVAEVPDEDVAHYRSVGAQLLPTPEQAMRRQRIEADRAGYEAEAERLNSQAIRELMAQGAGAAASMLIPGGPAVRAGMKVPELIAALAARSGMGALGGATGGGVEAGLSGEEVLPAMGRGAATGAAFAPGFAMAGRAANELGSAAGRVAVKGARALEDLADRPVIRRIPGARMVRNMAGDVVEQSERGASPAAPAPAPMPEPSPPATPAERIKAMRPLRSNASRQERISRRADLEDAMREAKYDAPTKRQLRIDLGHEAAPGAAKGRVVGEIGPAPKPAKGAAPAKGTAESRVLKIPEKATGPVAKPRHDVRYYSKSRGEHIDIEKMNQKHIEQAYRELAETNPKPGSVAHKQMEALLEESKYRLQKTDIHIGQANPRRAAK